MYKYTPKIKNTTGKIYSLLLLICGVILFFLPIIQNIKFGALIQSAGIILITAAVYICTAYLLRNYTFSVDNSEQKTVDVFGDEYENPIQRIDFTVYDNKPRRSILVCRIGLDEIKRVEIMEKKNQKELKQSAKNYNRYKYDSTFIPSKQIVVFTKDDCVFVTFDERLYHILNSGK